MIALEEISPVGFGGHLVSDDNDEHRCALQRALSKGCNLIDTSPNYMRGASERLVGQVLKGETRPVFVMSKSGYDEAEQLPIVERGPARGNLLHPTFLENRISLSVSRMGRDLDGFLLHSPEQYLEEQVSAEGRASFYRRLADAFQFLESKVSAGRIRYYGISSNTIALPADDTPRLDLNEVMRVVDSIGANCRFRLLQFPYNFAEPHAGIDQRGRRNLICEAKARGLVTFSNRPLNGRTTEGPVRLASYRRRKQPIDAQAFARSEAAIAGQLRRAGANEAPLDFPVIRFLRDNWDRLGNPEAVEDLFLSHLQPFLHVLYGGKVGKDDQRTFDRLYHAALAHSRRKRQRRTGAFLRMLRRSGEISADDDRPLPVIACETYLRKGIDHVLVGMRRAAYVDELSGFFVPARPIAA